MADAMVTERSVGLEFRANMQPCHRDIRGVAVARYKLQRQQGTGNRCGVVALFVVLFRLSRRVGGPW